MGMLATEYNRLVEAICDVLRKSEKLCTDSNIVMELMRMTDRDIENVVSDKRKG